MGPSGETYHPAVPLTGADQRSPQQDAYCCVSDPFLESISDRRRPGILLRQRHIDLWSQVQQLALEGNDIDNIAAITGRRSEIVMMYLSIEQLPCRPLRTKERRLPRRTALDAMIGEGETLDAMRKEMHVTQQAVRQYIITSGQHEQWRENRRTATSLKKQRWEKLLQIVELVKMQAVRCAYKESWAHGVALAYLQRHKRSRQSLETLTSFFGEYQLLKQSGKGSYQHIGDYIGVSAASARDIVLDAGLAPLRWTVHAVPRATLPSAEEFLNLARLGMGPQDITYFFNIAGRPVKKSFVQSRLSEADHVFLGSKSPYVSYAVASKTYEAQDAGFSIEETAKLLDISIGVVRHAHQVRSSIEPVIATALRSIDPLRKKDCPY